MIKSTSLYLFSLSNFILSNNTKGQSMIDKKLFGTLPTAVKFIPIL
jgi:hypothetical protein